jgi:DNA-binding protein H-NS
MAVLNGKVSEKSVTVWFSGLGFDEQALVLAKLSEAHDEQRDKKRALLMEQLSALGGVMPKKRGRPATNERQVLKRKGKAAIKYRDPKSGDTWSGRGRMARWLAEKVKAGEKQDSYLV